ncbi:MAG: hypothetical protein Q8L15_00960 [Methylobacter sp.]|jgi:TolB-like protein|nr:hypothetical protein [Methylobacter sp.]
MTASKKEINVATAVPVVEAQATLRLILASALFINAPRMSRLLRFLVDKAITGAAREVCEYAIGIAVFDQKASYNTNENPVVRVQIGRLREKLKTYYATTGAGLDIEISIPMGSYMPTIQRKSAANTKLKQCYLLAIHPFKCITHHHAEGIPFTQGLNEELMHQLFKVFGTIIVPHSIFTSNYADNESRTFKNTPGVGVNHLLEGSVQVNADRIRASIRLVDVSIGCIAWSEQFDRNPFFVIAHQEELASSICCALKSFLSRE